LRYRQGVIVFESIARPLMVVHGISAAVLVASTTHHLLWCRGYLRGKFGRQKGERRFALIAAIAFLTTFVLGNALYPTYKVRVRAEYFDNPGAIAAEVRLREEQHRAIGAEVAADTRPPKLGVGLAWVGRLFDVKEHWVAFGCMASLVLLVLSRRAHPTDHPRVVPLYVGLSAAACMTAWLGAIVGLLTASYRSVGGAL
jgi:hypothetical protein